MCKYLRSSDVNVDGKVNAKTKIILFFLKLNLIFYIIFLNNVNFSIKFVYQLGSKVYLSNIIFL